MARCDLDRSAACGTISTWVVAGYRESGSTTDFYAALATDTQAARSRYNATHTPALTTNTYTAHLRPEDVDHLRYLAEAATRFERKLATSIKNLTHASLLDGHEHAAIVGGARLGIQIRAEDGHETYVAVRIIGSVPDTLVVTVLDLVPGCSLDGWFPEYSLPERPLEAAEQAWSNIMDPTEAAKILDTMA